MKHTFLPLFTLANTTYNNFNYYKYYANRKLLLISTNLKMNKHKDIPLFLDTFISEKNSTLSETIYVRARVGAYVYVYILFICIFFSAFACNFSSEYECARPDTHTHTRYEDLYKSE